MEIITRPMNWNKLRYDREFDVNLALQLLSEEFDELLDAKERVDQLDAAIDIFFVSVGAFWKRGYSSGGVEQLLKNFITPMHSVTELQLVSCLSIAMNRLCHEPSDVDQLVAVLRYSYQLTYLITNGRAEEAILIVCDANDLKTAKKTASDVKANIDKGTNFVPPEARLQELLNEC